MVQAASPVDVFQKNLSCGSGARINRGTYTDEARDTANRNNESVRTQRTLLNSRCAPLSSDPLRIAGSRLLCRQPRRGTVDYMAAGDFSRALVSHWRELQDKLRSQDEEITIDGQSLNLAAVVACARYALT